MDADGRIIPLVEDDQGEGIKDFVIDPLEHIEKMKEAMLEGKEVLTKGKTENEMLEQINDKLDRLLEVFGGHRLIDGRFVDISKALPYNSISVK
ncbi:hypothetical protein E3J48_02570 [Candidatus Aerophobetes bacterium]|uniref:Uncharacterized protein n=1 Tax=Aerophobetes bacterium TaxID=2030807 RepID=A0A523W8M9_UNCAE|nr:MAG: hypothetical protein E3J48_02570 [Candidatus Aerophobetes bacterium]